MDTSSLPTLRFDPTRVTPTVEGEAATALQTFSEIGEEHFAQVHQAALRMIRAGGNQPELYTALLDIGLPKGRAREITSAVNSRVFSLMDRDRCLALGIVEAEWLYSGAPCLPNRKRPTPQDERRDAEHRAANGMRYQLREGLLIGERYVRPGEEPGCSCRSRPIIAFDG